MNKIYRIIDANLNRSKEGLRVCEEILRFVYEDAEVTGRIKNIRRKISDIAKSLPVNIEILISSRDSEDDKGNVWDDSARSDYKDLFMANIQRVKEALRALEEFSKTLSVETSNAFRQLRFEVYTLEKGIIQKQVKKFS